MYLGLSTTETLEIDGEDFGVKLNTNEQCNTETYQNWEKPWLHTHLQRYGQTCLTMCFFHISHMMVTHAAQSCKDFLNKTLVFSSSYEGSYARQTIFLASLFLGWQRDRNHIPIAWRPTVQSIHQYLSICLMEAQYSQELLNWELQGGCKAEQRTSN